MNERHGGEFFDLTTAASLDGWEHVPDDVLRDVVTRDGACSRLYGMGMVPEWSGDDATDREVAARICAGCPVALPCLEWELRTSGVFALGVWGALPAEDVRALYPVWRERRERHEGLSDGEIGGRA